MQIKSDDWHRVVEGNDVPYECIVDIFTAGRTCARVGEGGFVSAPDNAGLTIATDLDLRVEFALDENAPGQTSMLLTKGQLGGTVTDMEWFLYMDTNEDQDLGIDGYETHFWIEWSANGTGAANVVNAANFWLNIGQVYAIRVTVDVNNGSGGNNVDFYIADNIEAFNIGGYTHVGPVTTAGTSSIFNGTGPILVGNINFGPGAGPDPYTDPMQGVIFKAEVRNGIGGSIVASPDFTKQTNDSPFADDQGNVWTFSGGILDRSGTDTETIVDFRQMQLESVQVQRDMTTDLPPNTRFITGYPAAQATITLSGPLVVNGEFTTVDEFMNPWNQDSPYYLTDWTNYFVTVYTVIYVDGVPDSTIQFAGVITELDNAHNNGGITIIAIDLSQSSLRNALVLPPVANPMNAPIGGGFIAEYRPGLTGLYIIDTLLRLNNIHSTPPPRDKCIFYTSLGGSCYPQIYSKYELPPEAGTAEQSTTLFQWTVNDGSGYPMQFVEGNFNKQICRDWSVVCTFDIGAFDGKFDLAVSPAIDQGFTWEFWANTDISGLPTNIQQNGGEILLTLSQSDGSGLSLWDVSLFFLSPEPAVDPSLNHWFFLASNTDEDASGLATQFDPTPGWHKFTVNMKFTSSTAFHLKFWLDGVLIGEQDRHLTTNVPLNQPIDSLIAASTLQCEAYQITSEADGTPSGDFTPGAVLDTSLNMLTGIVDTTGKDPWQVMQQVIEAELGFGGFDETGIFRFYNRDTLRSGTPVREIHSRHSLKTVQTQTQKSMVVNWVQVPFAPLSISPYQAVWNVGGTLYYASANNAFGIFVQFDKPVIALSTFSGVIPSGGIFAHGGADPAQNHALSGWRGAKKPDGSGGEVTSGIAMFIEQLSPTTVWLVIQNTNAYTVYFATPPGYPTAQGTPCLSLGGQFIAPGEAVAPDTDVATGGTSMVDAQWPPSDQGGAASSPYGIKQLQVQANPWRQTQQSAQELADAILGDLYQPRPILQQVVITMDPSLQLADRVTLVDPDRSKLDDDGQVFSITTNMSRSDATQTLNLQTIGSPGAWLLGISGHGEMGVNTRV